MEYVGPYWNKAFIVKYKCAHRSAGWPQNHTLTLKLKCKIIDILHCYVWGRGGRSAPTHLNEKSTICWKLSKNTVNYCSQVQQIIFTQLTYFLICVWWFHWEPMKITFISRLRHIKINTDMESVKKKAKMMRHILYFIQKTN